MTVFSITSLNEAVRLYVRARYISEGLGPGGFSTKATVSTNDETPSFGEKTQKELGNIARQRKKHKEKQFEISPNLQASFDAGKLTFTDDELAHLRSRAQQAIAHARSQLGESAHYCAAMLRTNDDCDGSCEDNPIYRELKYGYNEYDLRRQSNGNM